MSGCFAERMARHRRFERRAEALPCVVAIDRLPAAESSAAHPECELVVATTLRGTTPAAVTELVVEAGLEIATARLHNNPDCRQVVVR